MTAPLLTVAQRRALDSINTTGNVFGGDWVEWLCAVGYTRRVRSADGNVTVYELTDAGSAALRGGK